MDGLRQRLQARIALLRKQRETDGKRGLKRGREATNGPLSAEDKEKLKQQRRKAKKLKRAEQRKQKARKDRTLFGTGASEVGLSSQPRAPPELRMILIQLLRQLHTFQQSATYSFPQLQG